MLSFTPADYDAIRISAKVAVAATVASLPFGFAVAYLLKYLTFRGKVLLEVAVNLPPTRRTAAIRAPSSVRAISFAGDFSG